MSDSLETIKDVEKFLESIDFKNVDYDKIATDYLNLHNIEVTDRQLMLTKNTPLLGVNIGLQISLNNI